MDAKPHVIALHDAASPMLAGLPFDHDVRLLTDIVQNPRAAEVVVLITTGSAPLRPEELRALPSLKMIVCLGSGYDGLPVDLIRASGIAISNSRSANAADVADHAVGLLLALRRKIFAGDCFLRSGLWSTSNNLPPSHSMRRMKIGIVGLGAIGSEIAARLAGFGCEIRYTGRRARQPSVDIDFVPELGSLAKWCDGLIVALRAAPDNHHLVNSTILQALGPSAVIINISRGSVVDEDAVIAMLRTGALGGAGLDVFDPEPTLASRWIDVPNTVLSPHIAGVTYEGLQLLRDILVEKVNTFLATGKIVMEV